MNNIEQEAIETYQKNLIYLEKTSENLYKLINILSKGIELGQIKENYILEYKDNSYFDILSLKDNTYLYNTNSNKHTNTLVKNINLDTKSDIFDTLFQNPKVLGEPYYFMEELFEYILENTTKNKKFHILPKFFFLGTLLGMHIPKIIEKLSIKKCFIYEYNLEVFRLSLFTTKYYEISEFTTITFSIMEDDIPFKENFRKFIFNNFNLNYGIKFHTLDMYEDRLKDITAMISANQAYKMNFLRRLNSLKHSFEKVINKNSILNINQAENILKDKRVLLLASGPSLEANINWVKENQNNFVIISVGANTPLLFQNNIKPDIIVEIHGDNDILETYETVDHKDLKDILFIAASQITNDVLTLFKSNNSFVFFNINLMKQHLGAIGGLSVGNVAIYLSQELNAKEVYLLGVDFAISDDGHTHISTHLQNKFDTVKEINIKEKNNIIADNLFSVQGNLKETVLTNSLFYQFLEDMNRTLKSYTNNKIYNLSNGAFIQNTIPININDILIGQNLDKKILQDELRTKLDNISEKGLRNEDITTLKYTIFNLEKYKYLNPKEFKDIRVFFNSIVTDSNLNSAYRELLLNFLQIIFHYVDGFLNDSKFKHKQQQKHIKNIDQLLYKNFIKLTDSYEDIMKKGILKEDES